LETTHIPGRFPRSSGILLHPTSLPNGHGIGDFGAEAYSYIDFLAEAQQRLWQILPLGPTGYGNSPYAALSAFAGNPLLISLDQLVDEGLIGRDGLGEVGAFPQGRVDYEGVTASKLPLLRQAAETFLRNASHERHARLAIFRKDNASWLDDFTLFMALRESLGGGWQQWPEALALRRPEALAAAREELRRAIDQHAVLQMLFTEQWAKVHRYAREHDVALVGDIPIFVALDSADVWAHRELFYLDEHGNPTIVAGVPPDYFSRTGQRWGNPLYRWEVLAERGYDWWIERFRAALETVDVIRIDHFRGFESYWAVPAANPTAEHGSWDRGPGVDLFVATRKALGTLPIIIEDLGLITPEVVALREELGYPGMKVLQFAWDSGPSNPFLPHNFVPNCVVYTGTHDNDTTVGWYQQAPEKERDYLQRYLGVEGQEIAWDLIRAAMASVADIAIVPAQDVLSLSTEHRMNLPGQPEGNWSWRLQPGQLTAEHAVRLARLATVYGRTPQDSREDTPEESRMP
jgi:4-alpha-glucanotransferase